MKINPKLLDFEIMEIVAETNKRAIKFTNGIMINTLKIPYSSRPVTTSWGGIYASSTITSSNFLVPFTAIFSCTGSVGISGGNHWFMFVDGDATLTKPANFQLLRGNSGTVSGTLSIIAIGTWK